MGGSAAAFVGRRHEGKGIVHSFTRIGAETCCWEAFAQVDTGDSFVTAWGVHLVDISTHSFVFLLFLDAGNGYWKWTLRSKL